MGSDPGKTVISWSTGDGSPGTIYVSVNDRQLRYPAKDLEALRQMISKHGFLAGLSMAIKEFQYRKEALKLSPFVSAVCKRSDSISKDLRDFSSQ